MQFWRKKGYKTAKVEQYNSFSGTRKDMFGFADLVCLKATGPIIAVQATTKSQMSDHLKRYRRDPEVRETLLWWIGTGSKVYIQGWSQPRGKGCRWVSDLREITPALLELMDRDKISLA